MRSSIKHKLLTKNVLLSLGWLNVVLAIIGALLPVMPTVPFLFLAAWCFARSSKRFHGWVVNLPLLGPIVRAWEGGERIARSTTRLGWIIAVWISLLFTAAVVVKPGWATVLLVCLGLVLTLFLMKLPVKD